MTSSLLPDRAILAVTGDDAEPLLNRLFTNSMLAMEAGAARYAALLSPQGKLLFDFLVYRQRMAFWIDCRRDHAADLARKLTMFRLRARADISLQPDLAVAAVWNSRLLEAPGPCFRDPRHDGLGYRIVAPIDHLSFARSDTGEYRAHRIGLGVPEGGTDWTYGDAFVHDANLDLLHGIDFGKGCYVGQEVVSRVHHRNSARKRIVRVHFHGDPPAVGADLVAGPLRIGQVTSCVGREGLASVRTDRLAEAVEVKAPLTAGDTLAEIRVPTAQPVLPVVYDDDSI